MGRWNAAVATYRQALDAVGAAPRTTELLEFLIGGQIEPRWIALSAPQVARMAHAIKENQLRAATLVALAQALPD
jgi:hypothetical protein